MNKFTNKQEYLAYRTQWKLDYKQLSQKIRDYKWMKKQYQRFASPIIAQYNQNYHTLSYTEVMKQINDILFTNEKYTELFKKYELKQYYQVFYMDGLKITATQMLLELKEAKIEAQRQYLAEKQSTVCA